MPSYTLGSHYRVYQGRALRAILAQHSLGDKLHAELLIYPMPHLLRAGWHLPQPHLAPLRSVAVYYKPMVRHRNSTRCSYRTNTRTIPYGVVKTGSVQTSRFWHEPVCPNKRGQKVNDGFGGSTMGEIIMCTKGDSSAMAGWLRAWNQALYPLCSSHLPAQKLSVELTVGIIERPRLGGEGHLCGHGAATAQTLEGLQFYYKQQGHDWSVKI